VHFNSGISNLTEREADEADAGAHGGEGGQGQGETSNGQQQLGTRRRRNNGLSK